MNHQWKVIHQKVKAILFNVINSCQIKDFQELKYFWPELGAKDIKMKKDMDFQFKLSGQNKPTKTSVLFVFLFSLKKLEF